MPVHEQRQPICQQHLQHQHNGGHVSTVTQQIFLSEIKLSLSLPLYNHRESCNWSAVLIRELRSAREKSNASS